MIRDRQDLELYREADRIGLRRSGARPALYDEVWIFQRLLRRVEYLHNTGANGLLRRYWSWRLHRQSVR